MGGQDARTVPPKENHRRMRLIVLKEKYALNVAHFQYLVRDNEDPRAIRVYWHVAAALVIHYDTIEERDADFFRAIKQLNRKPRNRKTA
jgi:hypothetical protein